MTFTDFLDSTGGKILIQSIGFLAMAIGILSFQRKRRAAIIGFQMTASTLWSIQFLLLGGYSGTIQNVLCIARGFVLVQKGKRKWADSYYTLAAIIFCFAATGFITVGLEGAWALLPIGASIASSIALFMDKEEILRKLSLIVSPLWLVYNVHTGSIAGIVAETFTIISILIALYRFREKKESRLQGEETSENKADDQSV